MKEPKHLSSLGYLAGIYQLDPHRIATELSAAGIQPVLVVDGIDYYPSHAVAEVFKIAEDKDRSRLTSDS